MSKTKVKEIYYDHKQKGLILFLKDNTTLVQCVEYKNGIPFTIFLTKEESEKRMQDQGGDSVSEKKQILLICSFIVSVATNIVLLSYLLVNQ